MKLTLASLPIFYTYAHCVCRYIWQSQIRYMLRIRYISLREIRYIFAMRKCVPTSYILHPKTTKE